MNPAGARRARRRHPWIYRSDLLVVPEGLENGAIVRVVDPAGRPLGRAGWSRESLISLRFVRWDDAPVDAAFWAARLEAALARRERAGMSGPARRIVFGEADEWPGLVVDQYGDCLSVQTLTPAADRWAPAWTRLLADRLAARAVVARNEVSVRRLEGLETGTQIWHGEPPAPFPVRIGDRTFRVDLLRGQKTGAFLDQQENYRAAARWADGAGRALDAFAGEGGFALHLAPVVGRVDAIESSETAVERGRANAEAEGIGNIEWSVVNAFDRLHELDAAGERFEVIVLDPPAFAKNKKSLPGARRGYKEINLRALRCLEPDGVLVTCSCSYHMSREMLLEIVAEAAGDAGREVELLEIRTQAPDHPILVNVPETEYLKCLVLRAR
ncbi:MAG TPA: class I SAM-dependent rRNA methyltransferase [Gemmatimonadota bacterium]